MSDAMHAEHALDMVSMQHLKPTQCLLNCKIVPDLEAQAASSGPLAASLAPPNPALAECRPPSWPPHQSRWGCLQSRPCLACTMTQSHTMQSNQAARTTSATRGFALRMQCPPAGLEGDALPLGIVVHSHPSTLLGLWAFADAHLVVPAQAFEAEQAITVCCLGYMSRLPKLHKCEHQADS